MKTLLIIVCCIAGCATDKGVMVKGNFIPCPYNGRRLTDLEQVDHQLWHWMLEESIRHPYVRPREEDHIADTGF